MEQNLFQVWDESEPGWDFRQIVAVEVQIGERGPLNLVLGNIGEEVREAVFVEINFFQTCEAEYGFW